MITLTALAVVFGTGFALKAAWSVVAGALASKPVSAEVPAR